MTPVRPLTTATLPGRPRVRGRERATEELPGVAPSRARCSLEAMTSTDGPAGVASTSGDSIEGALEQHRIELTGYCYRMLGSAADAEDAVQETLTRAWRSIDRFEGRATMRTWLYKIASNVCFDALAATKKRAMPMDMGPAQDAHEPLAPPTSDSDWVEPVPTAMVLDLGVDPAIASEARESVRIAFIAALQHLPARQRAVLILREVLGWEASEVAELLHLTVPAVNSALQRARATLTSRDLEIQQLSPQAVDEASEALLERYVEAFESYDMEKLTAVLHDDATQSMPPYPMWLAGRDSVLDFWFTKGIGCAGSKMVSVDVNGEPGLAQYRDGGATPWGIHLLRLAADGRVAEVTIFLETDGSLFRTFGLPERLPGVPADAPTPGAAAPHRPGFIAA